MLNFKLLYLFITWYISSTKYMSSYYKLVGCFYICTVIPFVNFAVQMFSSSYFTCFCVSGCFVDSVDAKYPGVGIQ